MWSVCPAARRQRWEAAGPREAPCPCSGCCGSAAAPPLRPGRRRSARSTALRRPAHISAVLGARRSHSRRGGKLSALAAPGRASARPGACRNHPGAPEAIRCPPDSAELWLLKVACAASKTSSDWKTKMTKSSFPARQAKDCLGQRCLGRQTRCRCPCLLLYLAVATARAAAAELSPLLLLQQLMLPLQAAGCCGCCCWSLLAVLPGRARLPQSLASGAVWPGVTSWLWRATAAAAVSAATEAIWNVSMTGAQGAVLPVHPLLQQHEQGPRFAARHCHDQHRHWRPRLLRHLHQQLCCG